MEYYTVIKNDVLDIDLWTWKDVYYLLYEKKIIKSYIEYDHVFARSITYD